MVTMRLVKSSSIRAVGYDEDAEELWVEYHSSPGVYGYQGVPRDVFVELEEAESKGGYVNRTIKGRFPYEYRPRPFGKLAPPGRRRQQHWSAPR
jgi:hypothetical protein